MHRMTSISQNFDFFCSSRLPKSLSSYDDTRLFRKHITYNQWIGLLTFRRDKYALNDPEFLNGPEFVIYS